MLLLDAWQHWPYQATRGEVRRHQRPARQADPFALLDGRQGRGGVLGLERGVAARVVPADAPQPVVPGLGATVDQRVACEIVEGFDRPQPGEQRRAADWNHPFIEQAFRFQSWPGSGAVQDGGMKIVAAEVERGPRRREPRFDLRVGTRELAKPRQQPALQKLARYTEVQHAADALATQPLDRPTQLVETAADARQQLRAFLRERDRARVPAEQRDSDLGLERLDLSTDGGGRDPELAGGGSEAQVGGDRFEDPQSIEWQAFLLDRHPCYSCKILIDNKRYRSFSQDLL